MDSDRIEQVYTELFSMGIELDSDPTISGPRYLNEVVARCRNYMNRVTMMLLELQRENRALSKAVAGLKLEFKIEFDQLIAENDSIKRLPNIKDRESTANVMLAAKRREIADLELQISDLDTIEKTVRLRHQELVRTSDNIKTQRSLLQTDRNTGAGYGDESRGDSRDTTASSIDESELDRLLQELSPGAAPAPAPAPAPVEPEALTEALPEASVRFYETTRNDLLGYERTSADALADEEGKVIAAIVKEAPTPEASPTLLEEVVTEASSRLIQRRSLTSTSSSTPEAPTPEVSPIPEAPTPEVSPIPEAPTPEAPIPEAPTPEAPTPEAPTPPASEATEDFELSRFLDDVGRDTPNLIATPKDSPKEATTSSKAKASKPTSKEVTKPNIDDFSDFDFAEILSKM